MNLFKSVFGHWEILQACFPNIAVLKACRSLKPSPPSFLRSFNVSHLCQCRAEFLLELRHQKVAIFLSIALIMEIGILKIDIAYWGIVWTTALRRISFPALESKLSFQLSNFELTLPNIQANISFLRTPSLKGSLNISQFSQFREFAAPIPYFF